MDNQLLNSVLRIPKRYHHTESDSKYYKAYKNECGIVFTGAVGTGKTHEAITLLKHLHKETGIGEPFRTATDFANKLRESVGDNRLHAVTEAFKNKELLFLDDLGVEHGTDFMMEKLNDVINYRYNQMLPVIITTNLSAEDFADVYGQRILSRLLGMTEFVKLTGKDRRIK